MNARPRAPGLWTTAASKAQSLKWWQEAETYIMSAMRKSSLIDGMFRRDIPEYPKEVLREALANAIAHRDYSAMFAVATSRCACSPTGSKCRARAGCSAT
jgi:hypothetical protein